MVDPARRVQHFDRVDSMSYPPGYEPPLRQPDQTLEYDKYRITPALLRRLELGASDHYGDPRLWTMETWVSMISTAAFRAGYKHALDLLTSLMHTQDMDQK